MDKEVGYYENTCKNRGTYIFPDDSVGGRDTAGKDEGGQYKDSREHGLERGKRCRYCRPSL